LQLIKESRERQELFFATEKRLLGFDHAELGGELLKTWKIPSNINEPVACHHIPQRAEQFPLEAAIIHFADIVCQAYELGGSGEWGVPPLNLAAWDRIGIPVATIGTIIKQSEPLIEETFAILTEE